MYFGKKQITAFATFKNESKIEEDLHVEVVENGEYNISAPAGTVYKSVSANVNVPVPEQQELSVDVAENGEFVNTAPDGKAYNKVTVNVNVPSKEEKELSVDIDENGSFVSTAPAGTAYNKVNVNVNVPSKEEQEKSVTISENGTIEVVPDAGKVLSSVKVTADVKSDITILDNVNIPLSFTDGDQVVDAGEGYAVRKATILKPETLIPENIAEGIDIAGVVGTHVGGGGAAADVRYVTFMNGSEVLYVKPVAVGDDCADIIARGLIGTPTKASTAQYNYTYYGWGASDGGAADANILKNITEDKTVYAIFTATVQYYTITWLDDDGVTELPGQKQWAYGTVPSYEPSKSGYIFGGWTTEIVSVTGDATYIATWEKGYSFALSSWEEIAQISEAGDASKYFAVGDTREQYMGETLGNVTLMILGFNHHLLKDGSGYAGMTIGMVTTSSTKMTHTTSLIKTGIPEEILAVCKAVKYHTYATGEKVSYSTSASYPIEAFSWTELGLTNSETGDTDAVVPEAVRQGLFPATAMEHNTTYVCEYWLNGRHTINSQQYYYYVSTSGLCSSIASSNTTSKKYYRGWFCV